MPLPVTNFVVNGARVYSIALKDRRQRPHRNKSWLFKLQLEAAIFGPRETSNGALNRLLQRISMNHSTLILNKQAVEEGIVMEEEFAQCLSLFQTEVLITECKAKTKNVTLVPTSIAKAAAEAHGRSPRTVELLRAMGHLSRQWVQLEERDALASENMIDPVLEDEIEQENPGIEESLAIDLATEILLASGGTYQEDAADAALMANYQLSPIPGPLATQLEGLTSFRSQAFNRHRSSGGAVMDITVKGDREVALRFLNFCVQQKQLPPDLKVLASPNVGQLVEEYLNFLRGLGLKASSLSNYVNSLISVSSYCLTLVEEPELVPTDELINLRRQCESISKTERLFQHKDPNFIEFTEAQKARVKSFQAYQTAPQPQKLKALRDYMIIAFHTLQCPDRVGVVRKMRLGTNLYKKEGETQYTVDLTSMKDSHKTTRFYGPTIHHLNAELSKVVDLYKNSLQMEFLDTERPYLFAQAANYSRGVSSQQWTQQVKQAFHKFTGLSPCPKTMRQSFICYLRSDSNVDKELMESAAKAMKHLVTTQGSADHYDIVQHDRLLKKANDYCLSVAAKFDPTISAASSSSASLDGPAFMAKLAGKQPASDHSATYTVSIPLADKTAGQKYSFPIQPSLNASIDFVIPETTEKSITLQFKLPKETPPQFELKGLTLVAPESSESMQEEAEGEAMDVDPKPARPPVPSKHLQPKVRSEVDASLAAIGYKPSVAKGDGDCYILSSCATFEIADIAQVANPSAATTELIRQMRVAAVNLATGTAPIGGIDSKTMRREEKIKVTSAAAAQQFAPWKQSFKWSTSKGRVASFFQFSISAHLNRPVAVIEIKDAEHYLDPARIYGMKDSSGSLRKEPAAPGKAESIPSFFLVPIADVMNILRTDPRSMSLIAYNGTDHFYPFVCTSPIPKPAQAPVAVSVSVPAKKQKVMAAAPSKEATITEAVSGIFSGYKIVESPPEGLSALLTENIAPLVGKLVIYNWESWGWAVGKLSPSDNKECNFAITYEGKWKEDQTLVVDAYGSGGHGNWMMLEQTRPASPIVEFKSGKYLVQRESGNVWLRAGELLHHPDSDLAAARATANMAKRRESQAAAEAELDVGGFAVGEIVYAKGLAPSGDVTFFQADVISIRERFPPLQIKYTATLDGKTESLLLPSPITAFVSTANVQSERPEEAVAGKRKARANVSYVEG